MLALIPYRFGLELLGELPEGIEVEVWDGTGEPPAGAGLWVPPWEPLDYASAFATLPELRVVQLMSAGYEHVASSVPAGVTLCNARGVHDANVAEWIVAAILAMLRDIPAHVRRQDARAPLQEETDTLGGKTVLSLGHGSIGEAVERLLAPFDVEFVRVAKHKRDGVHPVDELPELLPRAGVLVILAPLNDETRGLVDAAALAALPDGALVVAASRGGIVDQDALLAELRAGRLRAALDVAEPDPLPPDHPLLGEPGVLYTPHVAGATRQTHPRVFAFVGDQLRSLGRGEPLLNVVST
ncbi:MAG TPA: NAD(P)-dependent oxidoreductase [Thermoleophilaceae bacterium]